MAKTSDKLRFVGHFQRHFALLPSLQGVSCVGTDQRVGPLIGFMRNRRGPTRRSAPTTHAIANCSRTPRRVDRAEAMIREGAPRLRWTASIPFAFAYTLSPAIRPAAEPV